MIKLALNGLGCPSVPDLFHALRDSAKVLGVSLSLKRAQVEEKLTHARQPLGGLEAKGHDPRVQRRWLAHLSAQAEGLRADRAIGQSTLHQASQAVHPFTLAESQAQSSAPRLSAGCTKPWRPSMPSMPPIRRATMERRCANSSAKSPRWPLPSMRGSSGWNTG